MKKNFFCIFVCKEGDDIQKFDLKYAITFVLKIGIRTFLNLVFFITFPASSGPMECIEKKYICAP